MQLENTYLDCQQVYKIVNTFLIKLFIVNICQHCIELILYSLYTVTLYNSYTYYNYHCYSFTAVQCTIMCSKLQIYFRRYIRWRMFFDVVSLENI